MGVSAICSPHCVIHNGTHDPLHKQARTTSRNGQQPATTQNVTQTTPLPPEMHNTKTAPDVVHEKTAMWR